MLFMNLLIFFISLCADTAASGEQRIDEGWRYHGSLQVVLPNTSEPLDLNSIHANMAQFVRSGDLLRRDRNACNAVVRFTCVHMIDDRPVLGRTLFLSSDMMEEGFSPDFPAFEIVFSSGYYADAEKVESKFDIDGSQGVILSPSNQKGSNLEGVDQKREPEIYRTPLRLCRLSRLSSEMIQADITRKWMSVSGSFLDQEGIKRVQDIHKRTLGQIQCVKDTRQEIERTLKMLEERNNCEGFLETYRNGLSKLDKDQQSKFSTNEDVNNYICAEQVSLIFLRHNVVVSNVRKFINQERTRIRNPLEYILINVCSSFTPCHHCTTSWVRECERGGGIAKIFEKLCEIRLVASCNLHYSRKEKSVPYSDINCLSVEAEAFNAPYISRDVFPYPVILLDKGAIVNDKSQIERFLRDGDSAEGRGSAEPVLPVGLLDDDE